MARARMGQNFLAGPAWQRRILDALRVTPQDVWIEIGAGHGEITEGLARAARRVIAVEADPSLAAQLRARARDWPAVEIVEADILKFDFAFARPDRARVFGSLPYYITSPILRHLFGAAERLRSIHVVTQLEVAARIAASPGVRDYGFLSVLCRFYSRPEILFRIPPGAFRPRPRVSSALVAMALPGAGAQLGIKDEEFFFRFVQCCFAQKRKTLANNLRAQFGAEKSEQLVRGMNLSPKVRAEELSVEDFARLYRELVLH